ncbi:MAG: dTDP-4-dehydrorhamnose reductase, partial [Eudoraea sp.]|uniref:dTDP-4-dehydrorhamnose reductase n=1 Tax=Eudoraea sp. TaxID=1979955 RepID=UPI003C7262FA
KCVQKIANNYDSLDFKFMDSKGLDITNPKSINSAFESGNFDYCINCAAYTNVEQAEKTPNIAFEVNAYAVKQLAIQCIKHNVVLIHISTDYVFDGKKEGGYLTTDLPNPINQYGMSKLAGENFIREILDKYYIIRTSWLYSEYGNNFYNTIVNKAKTESVLYITDEQTGCPTNANNLVKYVLNLIISQNTEYGIYHFTDGKAMTWYDFAKEILRETNLDEKVRVEKAKNYCTFAKRPKTSILKHNKNSLNG